MKQKSNNGKIWKILLAVTITLVLSAVSYIVINSNLLGA